MLRKISNAKTASVERTACLAGSRSSSIIYKTRYIIETKKVNAPDVFRCISQLRIASRVRRIMSPVYAQAVLCLSMYVISLSLSF